MRFPSEDDIEAAYWEGKRIEEAEKAERIEEYNTSPAQRDWESDEEGDPFDAAEAPTPYGLRYEDTDDGQGWY